jgi:Zn-finger nucleic acid-binding protein
MTEARTYRCPTCGGEVEEQARTCRWCGAPVATIRCAHCFHMNGPEAIHCSGCGREIGLAPVGDPDSWKCPHCDVRFEAIPTSAGTLHDCPHCGGQFVDHELLQDLLEQKQTCVVVPRSLRRNNPLRDPVRYIPCPACGALMNRRNFGRTSGVIVDVCTQHGIYFDQGELPQVLAFVERGGLAQAQSRVEDEARRVKEPPASLRILPESEPNDAADLVQTFEEAAEDLWHFLRERVRRR